MFIDHMTLADSLRDYASPRAKITRMIRSGEVIQLRRGLFLDGKEKDYSIRSIASVLYGPSYISFEYALSAYGMIPERTNAVTSAIYGKNKDKKFHTPVGDFYYRCLPAAAFPYGVARETENGRSYLIALPEKALCDSIYKVNGVGSPELLESLLFDQWRMDEGRVTKLNRKLIRFLAPLYRRKSLLFFAEWVEKEVGRA